ncbi:MAG: hypothetical protein GVY13_09085 [Alphaproteobacteria bacterium]|jgi:hypothetical protein|nr:hypothetical protein [Alphaproteobacteria bacterium]
MSVQFRFDGVPGATAFAADDIFSSDSFATFGLFARFGVFNSPPVAEDDTAVIPADSAVTIDILANDGDPDGDPLTALVPEQPAHGTVSATEDGRLIYTPDAGFTGTDSFAYVLGDGKAGRDTATVTITVEEPRGAPDSEPAPEAPAIPELATSEDEAYGLSVAFDDPTGTLAPYEAEITAAAELGWAQWAESFQQLAPIELEVRYEPGDALASARPATWVPVTDAESGETLWQSSVAYELATGEDPNGDAPDAIINIVANPEIFAWRDSLDEPVPADQIDAVTVFAHEFGHTLGISGFAGSPLGLFGVESTYDQYVQRTGGNSFVFTGPNAMAENGGPVALRDGDPHHIEAESDLMSWALAPGQAETVSALDIAILADIGLPMAEAAPIA